MLWHNRLIRRAFHGGKIIKHTLETDHPLFQAAIRGDCAAVKELIQSKQCSITDCNAFGKTALHFAAENDRDETILTLVMNGAELNFSGTYGRPPIHDAANVGANKAVKSLLELGAEADTKGADGCTPLHLAAFNGHLDTVVTLCEHHVYINATDELNGSEAVGNTALHLAIIKGHIEVALKLIEMGANCTAKNASDETPFSLATKNPAFEKVVAEMLRLANEAVGDNTLLEKVNEIDAEGNNALHRAARTGASNSIRIYCEQGAVVNLRNVRRRTPLSEAVQIAELSRKMGQTEDELVTRQVPVVEELLNQHADTTLGDEEENTPLHITAGNGHLPLLELLCVGEINLRNKLRETPLHVAASKQQYSAVIKLCEENADVNALDVSSNSPLHLLIEGVDEDDLEDTDVLAQFEECVAMLLAHGALVNQKNIGATGDENESVLELVEDKFDDESAVLQMIKEASLKELAITAQTVSLSPTHHSEETDAETEEEEIVTVAPKAPIAVTPIAQPIQKNESLEALCKEMLTSYKRKSSVVDKDLESFCNDMSKSATFEFRNDNGENFLHILAKNPNRAELFNLFTNKLNPKQLQALLIQQTHTGETPLFYVCQFRNKKMSKAIATKSTREEFFAQCSIKNIEGMNAIQALLYNCLPASVQEFKKHLNTAQRVDFSQLDRDYLLKRHNGVQLEEQITIESSTTNMLDLLLKKFDEKAVTELILATDKYGFNATMLALFHNLHKLLDQLLIPLNKDDAHKALTQSLVNTPITPLQFGFAFCNLMFIKSIMRTVVTDVLIAQDALGWTCKTKSHERDYVREIFKTLAGVYGNKLERRIVSTEDIPSLLVRSLNGDGFLVEILLSMKPPGSMKYAILLNTFSGWCNQASPRTGKFFTEDRSIVEQRRIKLLRHIFRLQWSVDIFKNIANLIESYRGDREVYHDNPKVFVLNILQTCLNKLTVNDPTNNFACIILATLYQVRWDKNSIDPTLEGKELQYIETCNSGQNKKKCFEWLIKLLQSLEGQPSAQDFLNRMWSSDSLYKAMIFKILDQKPLDGFTKDSRDLFISQIQSMLEEPLSSINKLE